LIKLPLLNKIWNYKPLEFKSICLLNMLSWKRLRRVRRVSFPLKAKLDFRRSFGSGRVPPRKEFGARRARAPYPNAVQTANTSFFCLFDSLFVCLFVCLKNSNNQDATNWGKYFKKVPKKSARPQSKQQCGMSLLRVR